MDTRHNYQFTGEKRGVWSERPDPIHLAQSNTDPLNAHIRDRNIDGLVDLVSCQVTVWARLT